MAVRLPLMPDPQVLRSTLPQSSPRREKRPLHGRGRHRTATVIYGAEAGAVDPGRTARFAPGSMPRRRGDEKGNFVVYVKTSQHPTTSPRRADLHQRSKRAVRPGSTGKTAKSPSSSGYRLRSRSFTKCPLSHRDGTTRTPWRSACGFGPRPARAIRPPPTCSGSPARGRCRKP